MAIGNSALLFLYCSLLSKDLSDTIVDLSFATSIPTQSFNTTTRTPLAPSDTPISSCRRLICATCTPGARYTLYRVTVGPCMALTSEISIL